MFLKALIGYGSAEGGMHTLQSLARRRGCLSAFDARRMYAAASLAGQTRSECRSLDDPGGNRGSSE